MRLLACFSKPPVILDDDDNTTTTTNNDNNSTIKYPDRPRRTADRKHSKKSAKSIPDPNIFVPTSIPELHPEYAHSEPYCFAARTDSARMIVEKMRGARGQPTVDRAAILKEQGVVVVRGPSYAAAQRQTGATQKENNTNNTTPKSPQKPVELRIESPTTAAEDHPNISDNENVDSENVPRSHARSSSTSKKSKTKSKRAFRKSKSAKKIKTKDRESRVENASSIRRSKSDRSVRQSKTPTVDPSPSVSDTVGSDESREDLAKKHLDEEIEKRMDNVPKALREPVMVPRVSWAYDRPKPVPSPPISGDSWAPNTCSQRYDDVEGDSSSGVLRNASNRIDDYPETLHDTIQHTYVPETLSRRPSTKTVQPDPTSFDDIPELTPDEMFQDASQGSTSTHSYISKRKSKPSIPARSLHDTSAPNIGETTGYDYNREHDRDPYSAARSYRDRDTKPTRNAIPEPSSIIRQGSVGTISDDIQVVDTSSQDLFTISSPSPAARTAAKERILHDDFMDIPRGDALGGTGIKRRASSKRKTVSFQEASPVIIEPNLRAPQSVPRSAVLSRDSTKILNKNNHSAHGQIAVTAELPTDLIPSLKQSHSSMTTSTTPGVNIPAGKEESSSKGSKSSIAPAPAGGIRSSISRQRELSDSSVEFEDAALEARLAKRLSQVSVVKDRQMARVASQRQSRAVAQAMAEQIRGVPKSAMLAYAENDFVPSDDYDEDDDSAASLGMKRRSRVVRSVRVPSVKPGQIPRPPPPPPFEPERPRVQSVRSPPPPPPSPLNRN